MNRVIQKADGDVEWPGGAQVDEHELACAAMALGTMGGTDIRFMTLAIAMDIRLMQAKRSLCNEQL